MKRPARTTPETGLAPEPLVRACEEYMRNHALTRTEFGRFVGIPERTLRRWGVAYTKAARNTEVALIYWATADEVITRMDMLWWDVYDDERWPEAHARAAVLLGGEREAVVA